MKVTLGLAVLLSGMVAMTINAKRESSAETPIAPAATHWDGRFVVHEWGTFTSFSGSDSVKLDFRPLVDADLPPFVLNRASQMGIPSPWSAKFGIMVPQRMETPVTYFYSDRPRQVKVRVGFPQGLLTEFYPPVVEMAPEFDWNKSETLRGSLLDWGQVWIVPEDRFRANVEDTTLANQLQAHLRRSILPGGHDNQHYSFARETDSALVYVERKPDKRRPLAPSGDFVEKFLFYRGLGNFELPLKLTAYADDRFELSNSGSEPIRSLFLVTVDGKQLRFVKYDQIGAGQRLSMAQSQSASSLDELAEAVVQALMAERLYEKEARAMVKTWRDSWFGEQGTRLFYMLPRRTTDDLLPLSIEPAPEEVVRVMVGRLEIMTPEDEARIAKLVSASLRNRAAAAKQAREFGQLMNYPLPQEILKLGRLAEPALVRVKSIATDAAVRAEADLLLAQLRAYRDTLAHSTSAAGQGSP